MNHPMQPRNNFTLPPQQNFRPVQNHQHHQGCQHSHGGHGNNNRNPNMQQNPNTMNHSGGGGHQHHAGCSHSHQSGPPQVSGYFQKLSDIYKSNRLFFFNEVLTGNCLVQIFHKIHLPFLNKLVMSRFLQQIITLFFSFTNGDCLSNSLRSIIASFFLPYIIFLYMNYKYLTNKVIQESPYQNLQENSLMITYIFSVVVIFLSTIVGSGTLNTDQFKLKTKQLIKKKPFMNNPRAICSECQILRCFRSQHCPMCKQCIPKFTKHSLLLNQCIGAHNQLMYLFALATINVSLILNLSISIINRNNINDSHASTIFFFYFINGYLLWLALIELVSILIFNFVYNCTQFQVKTWMMQPYLTAYMKREFANPLDIGFCNNVKQSIYAFMNYSDEQEQSYEIIEEESSILSSSGYHQPKNKKQKKSILTNWNKAFYYNAGQIPNHPNRKQINEKMAEMQGKMASQMKLMEQIRIKITRQNEGKLNPQQINQMVMMQMQMQMHKEMQKSMMIQKQQEMQNAMKKKAQQESQLKSKTAPLVQKQEKNKDQAHLLDDNDSDDDHNKNQDQESLNKKKNKYLRIQGEDENI